MTNLEKTLSKVEDEIKALKNAYEQTALQIPVFTYSIDFTTLVNNLTITYPGGQSLSFEGWGRTVVTFTSARGANALAFLELQFDDGGYGMATFKIRRVPYAGGARWIVSDTGGPIDYRFVVHSAVEGTLEARMVWQ